MFSFISLSSLGIFIVIVALGGSVAEDATASAAAALDSTGPDPNDTDATIDDQHDLNSPKRNGSAQMNLSVEDRIALWLWLNVPPVLIVFGTCGNVLCVVVLCQKTFRKSSVGFTLSALAVVDTGALVVSLLPIWLESRFGVNLSRGSIWFTSFMIFGDVLKNGSSYTLVVLTLERAMSICLPMLTMVHLTRRCVIWTWSVVSLIAAIINVVLLLPQLVNYKWILMTILVYQAFIPFVILLVSNIVVVAFVIRSVRVRRCLRQTSSVTTPSSASVVVVSTAGASVGDKASIEVVPIQGGRREPGQSQPPLVTWSTVMLMSPSLFFLLTVFPVAIILFSCLFLHETEMCRPLPKTVSILLFFTNNAANFLLYCVMGSRFRDATRQLFSRCCVCISK